jgi:hypothetical protein
MTLLGTLDIILRAGFQASGTREYGVPHTPIHVRPRGKPVEVRR